eukprot:310286-Rhodomonas_salina.2
MTPSMRCTTPLSRRKFSFSSSWISSAALASSGFIVFVDAQTIKAIKFAPIHTLQPQQPRASVLQRFPRGALVRCDLNSGKHRNRGTKIKLPENGLPNWLDRTTPRTQGSGEEKDETRGGSVVEGGVRSERRVNK